MFDRLELALFFVYIALSALSVVMARSRPVGTKSRSELVLIILAQGILVFILLRMLINAPFN